MKLLTIIFQVFFSVLILTPKLFAQYDAGTVIHSVNGEFNFGAIQKNFKVVDFDNDSWLDILVVKDENPNQLTWYKGDGSGNFIEQTTLFEVDNNHINKDIFYEDMDGDNIKDIVFQNSNTRFTILISDGQGNIFTQIANEVTFDNPLESDLKQIADMDGDGDMDGIFWNKTDILRTYMRYNPIGECIIGYNNGSGTFTNYIYLDNERPEMFFTIKTVDIDEDGDMDVISSGQYAYLIRFNYFSTTSIITLYENLGSNNFYKNPILAFDYYTNSHLVYFFSNIKTQDINSDGKEELLIELAQTNRCGIHGEICGSKPEFYVMEYDVQNKEFNFLEDYNSWLHGYVVDESQYGSPQILDNAFHMQFGQQNADDNLDILSVNVPQGKLHWYFGDGNGNFNTTQTVNFNSQYSSTIPTLSVADIDNDTDLDIFVLLNNDFSSTLTVFKNMAISPACSAILELQDAELSSGTYQAGITITSYGNIAQDNDVTLKGGNNVTLLNHFSAPANSTLQIKIGSCD